MGIKDKQDFRFGHALLRFICKLIPALFGVMLVVVIVLIPFVSTSNGAMEVKTIRPAYLAKDINIDGVHVDNFLLDKPILHAHGEVYIPATRQMLSALGIRYASAYSEVEQFSYQNPWTTPFYKTARTWIRKSRQESADAVDLLEFRLDKALPIEVGFDLVTNLKCYETLSTSPEEFWIARVNQFGDSDIRNGWDRLLTIYRENPNITLDDIGKDFFADIADSHTEADSAESTSIRSELTSDNPFRIVSRDGSELYFDADGMMYFSSDFLEKLGMDCEYDDLTGLYISTDPLVSAESLYDEKLADRINVLSDYILSCNKKLDKDTAIEYEYIFRHEAAVYGLDELLIMAVAKTESNFRSEAKGSGTIGMMQPMAKYAVNYGYDYEMLLNPHYNIELCSMYLRDRYHMFGSEELMLVAYNKGPASVRAGRRHSDYSDKVLKTKNAILELLNITNQSI